MTLQQPKPDFRSSIASMDYNDNLRQAYYDCVISLNSFQAESQTIPGLGPSFKAELATERFVGCVLILDSMITDDMKDDLFKPIEKKFQKAKGNLWRPSLECFNAITELFKRKGIWKVTSSFLGRL